MTTELSKLLEYLKGLMKSRLYGKVIISFTDGHITLIKTEQTVRIDDLNNKSEH